MGACLYSFLGFCERGQIFSCLAKSRIWRAFLSFCALIFWNLFGYFSLFWPRTHTSLCAIFDNVASTHDTSTPETSDVQNITYQIALSARNVERVFVVLSIYLSLY